MAQEVWHPNATRQQLEDAGPFTGGGRKFLVHTTEGWTLEGAFQTLSANRDAPHFILEVKNGRRRLVQCIPINLAARTLEHPNGTPETNRASCVQVEVVGFTDERAAQTLGHPELYVGHWAPEVYRYLHLLMQWTHTNFGVPMQALHPFPGQTGYARLSGAAFFETSGLVGHCHAANNSHTDPGPLHAALTVNGPEIAHA